MKFIRNLDPEVYKNWNETHMYGQILQSEEWGQFKGKGEWTYELLGLMDHEELVGACMMLKRKLPMMNRYMFYASRGFLLDYKNTEVLKVFTKEIYAYAKKNKGVMVKIDPCVIYQERDADGEIVQDGFDNKDVVDALLDLGYKHKGITLDFDGIQPRFVYRLPLDRPLDELMAKFHHKTRYNIKVAQKKGIEIYEGTREDLVEFERIMKVTGARDGFITRPLSYFQQMYDVLHPKGKMKLYIAKYNVSEALKATAINLEAEKCKTKQDEVRILKLEDEKVELEELVVKNPKGIIVSGTIMLINGKSAEYLYGASDNLYRNIMPNYLIQWQMIQDAYNMGCIMYDFRGISGDRNPENHLYGLYRFKRGFTGEFVEYIGEFDLVLRPFSYGLFEWGLPKVKSIIRKLKR